MTRSTLMTSKSMFENINIYVPYTVGSLRGKSLYQVTRSLTSMSTALQLATAAYLGHTTCILLAASAPCRPLGAKRRCGTKLGLILNFSFKLSAVSIVPNGVHVIHIFLFGSALNIFKEDHINCGFLFESV